MYLDSKEDYVLDMWPGTKNVLNLRSNHGKCGFVECSKVEVTQRMEVNCRIEGSQGYETMSLLKGGGASVIRENAPLAAWVQLTTSHPTI